MATVTGGPYAAFGGRDASRGLATFSVTTSEKVEYDDLSDLNPMEMESVREWEMQFKGEQAQAVVVVRSVQPAHSILPLLSRRIYLFNFLDGTFAGSLFYQHCLSTPTYLQVT